MSSLELGKLFFPLDASCHLHHDEQRQNRSDRDGEACEPFVEKGIREQHEEEKLRQASLHGGEAKSHDEPEVTHHQEDRNQGADEKRGVNRNVIHKVRQEKVESKKRRCQEEIVHRMQVDAGLRGDDKHQKEKEEQRDWRKIADLSRQRARL